MDEAKQQKAFNLFFWVVAAIVFVIIGFRCALVPFNHDETATFFYYIQTGKFLPFRSHVDANNHVLNSFLSWISYKLFGDSPFALRLPNFLAFIALAYGTWKMCAYLKHLLSKIALSTLLILSFHWLSFYSVCRGYGLSMSFLLLGLAFMLDYFKTKRSYDLIWVYFFLQAAVASNLILIIPLLFLTGAVVLFQFINKALLVKLNLFLLLLHTLTALCWVGWSLFLQKGNALYYGAGESYWKVTFVTLIELLTGAINSYITVIILLLFIALIIAAIIINYRKIKRLSDLYLSPSLFFTVALLTLIASFYLMHLVLDVNFPEDRTGLFFYLFFVLALVFTIDNYPVRYSGIILLPLTVIVVLHFYANINLRKHSLVAYDTMPQRFYDKLVEEQSKSSQKITIGGHRIRELFYAFMNYRHGGALNLQDAPETMLMNCDYNISHKRIRTYYEPYYTEIDEDKDWGFTLLKRKTPILRNLLLSIDTLPGKEGWNEFYEFYNTTDTAFENKNPLMAEVDIAIEKTESPFQGWLVFSIDSLEGQSSFYKRAPLNWLRADWNGKSQNLHLVTGPLPDKVQRISCYLWNSKKQYVKYKINSLKIYQLEGNGVRASAPIY